MVDRLKATLPKVTSPGLTLGLIFGVQFAFFPFFFGFNIVAKFYFFAIFFILLLLHHRKHLTSTIAPPLLSVVFISSLLCSTLAAFHIPSALTAAGPLILLWVYALWYFPNVFPRGLDDRFFFLFLLFVQIVAWLGFYQYLSFLLHGPSSVSLIPYLLPPNQLQRIGGIYGQPNLFAVMLLVGILVYFYVLLHGARASGGLIHRLHHLPLMTMCLAFFLTGSRAGLIGFSLAFFFMLLYLLQRGYFKNSSRLRSSLLSALAIVGFTYLFAVFVDRQAGHYFANFGSATGWSSDARFVFWTAALLIFLDHPWLGVGLDNYKFLLPEYLPQAHNLLGFVSYESMGYTKWAHSELLQLQCEGGILIGLGAAALLLLYGRLLWVCARKGGRGSLRYFFSLLFLLPFIVHSFFSWPLRHPALLVLFLGFLGSCLCLGTSRRYPIGPLGRRFLQGLAAAAIVGLVYVGAQEVRLQNFFQDVDRSRVQDSYKQFKVLAQEPYSEFLILKNLVPLYIRSAVDSGDAELASRLVPYAERLVDLHGSDAQWYVLARLYHFLGQRSEALTAVAQAIDLKPMERSYWNFQHQMIVEKASEETGRPISDFQPPPWARVFSADTLVTGKNDVDHIFRERTQDLQIPPVQEKDTGRQRP